MAQKIAPRALSLKEVAESLGLSPSGVSRLRSGARHPSLETMQNIESQYGWSVQAQSEARKEGVWHLYFAAVLEAFDSGDSE